MQIINMNKVLLLFCLFISTISFSQIEIKGKVLDKLTKEELIGANVIIKKNNTGVTTNYKGEFTINTNSKLFPIKLEVSYIGYTKSNILISEKDYQERKSFNI